VLLTLGTRDTRPSCRCTTFLGLLNSCAVTADGNRVLKPFPSWNCEEVQYRVHIAWAGTVALCFGIPLVCMVFAVLFKRRVFRSPKSYFLIRSMFSGYKATAGGFAFRIWMFLRAMGIVWMSTESNMTEAAQTIGILLLVVVTLAFEVILLPRSTAIMTILESIGELCICIVVGCGYISSGAASIALPPIVTVLGGMAGAPGHSQTYLNRMAVV
jgi:hypothetical protein